MGAVAFIGYFLLGLGPSLVVFSNAIIRKSFLVIVTLSSAFFWLLSLMLIALVWRGLLPLPPRVGPYAALLITSVLIQELFRVIYCEQNLRLAKWLDLLAVRLRRPKLTRADKLQIALAGGLGHGVVHSAIFFLALLTPTLGLATYYVDACPQMPLFLVMALSGLAFSLIHGALMVIAVDAREHSQLPLRLLPLGLHMTAALVCLINFAPGGCLASAPLLLGLGGAAAAICSKTTWDQSD